MTIEINHTQNEQGQRTDADSAVADTSLAGYDASTAFDHHEADALDAALDLAADEAARADAALSRDAGPDDDAYVDISHLFTVRWSGGPLRPGRDINGQATSPFAAPDDDLAQAATQATRRRPGLPDGSYLVCAQFFSDDGMPTIDLTYVTAESLRQEAERADRERAAEREAATGPLYDESDDEIAPPDYQQPRAGSQRVTDAVLAAREMRKSEFERTLLRPLAARLRNAYAPQANPDGTIRYDAFGIPIPSQNFRLIPYRGGFEDLEFLRQERRGAKKS